MDEKTFELLQKINERLAAQDLALAVQTSILNRLAGRLEGENGQLGVFRELDQLKASHEACQREKREARQEALAQADAGLKKAIAVASVLATLIATLIGKIL
jgi:hypothetical protein